MYVYQHTLLDNNVIYTLLNGPLFRTTIFLKLHQNCLRNYYRITNTKKLLLHIHIYDTRKIHHNCICISMCYNNYYKSN